MKTLDELNVLRSNFVIDANNKKNRIIEARKTIETLQPDLEELDMAIMEVDKQIKELTH